MSVRRTILVVAASVLAVALAIGLAAGLITDSARIGALFVACLLVASIVALLPGGLRARLAVPVGAFVTAGGILSVFLPNNDGNSAPHNPVNVAYLADLVRRGPFTETLPKPLVAGRMDDVGISDPSAAGRIQAAQLHVRPDPHAGPEEGSDIAAFAQVEIYPSPTASAKRKRASLRDLAQRNGKNHVRGNCVDVYPNGWTCVGSRGYAYSEVSLSPSANAYLPLAQGTVVALLDYSDRLTKQAQAP